MDAHSYDEHKRYRSTLLEIHKCGSKHMKKDGIQENDKWHLYYICYCFRIYTISIYIYILFIFAIWGVTAMRSTSKSIGLRRVCKAECCCLTATMDDFCFFHMCQLGNSETINHHTQTQNTKEAKATGSWGRGGLERVWLSRCLEKRHFLAPNARHGRRWHRLDYITFRTQSCWHQLQSIPSLHPLPSDPTVVIEADGQDGAKAILKKMTWPLMDDDALPSSYTTRVLTCVSKWRVKMQTLVEAFESDPDETENTKQNLSLIIKLYALHVRWYIYIDLQDLFFDIKLMWKESESWFTKGQFKGPTDWCWADEVHRQDHWHQHSGDLQRFQEWVPSLLDVWIIYDQIVFQSNWNLTWIKSLDLALQPLHHSLTCPATSGIKMT